MPEYKAPLRDMRFLIDEVFDFHYTSGSTGAPKGVMHSLRNTLGFCRAFATELLALQAGGGIRACGAPLPRRTEMPEYKAPLRDMRFLIDEVFDFHYTSGSTGAPKGVMHSLRNTLGFCRAFATELLALQAGDRLYSIPKMFFGYGMGNSLFFPW